MKEIDVQELLDKQAITEAIYSYGRAMDRLDHEVGYALFWPDAIADYGEMYQGTGVGFVDMVLEAHLDFVAHSHQCSNVLITIEGATAWSETYVDATLRRTGEDGTYIDNRNLGRYVDRWEKRHGEWRIVKRTYLHDFDQVLVSVATFATTGRRDRQDASYERR